MRVREDEREGERKLQRREGEKTMRGRREERKEKKLNGDVATS